LICHQCLDSMEITALWGSKELWKSRVHDVTGSATPSGRKDGNTITRGGSRCLSAAARRPARHPSRLNLTTRNLVPAVSLLSKPGVPGREGVGGEPMQGIFSPWKGMAVQAGRLTASTPRTTARLHVITV